VPFDPRLMEVVPPPSPRRRWIPASRASRSPTWTPIAHSLKGAAQPDRHVAAAQLRARCRRNPKRVVFAEGEEEGDARRVQFARRRLWHAGAGRPRRGGAETLRALGVADPESFEIHNSASARWSKLHGRLLYERLQRRGYPAPRLPAHGQPGPQRLRRAACSSWARRCDDHRHHAHLRQTMREVRQVIDPEPGRRRFGIHVLVGKATRCSWPTPPSTSCRPRSNWPTIAEQPRSRRAPHGA
jgi:malate dehydrogenase (oxaloacetate-decarboxylating)(NADP+)